MSLLQGNMVAGANQSASSAVATAMTANRRTGRAGAKDTSGTSGTGNTAGTGSSEITSNDFLTLLVSELKNQDPTQPTDPNAYIQQLVGVNSLQQLIQINKKVGAIAPSTSASTQSS